MNESLNKIFHHRIASAADPAPPDIVGARKQINSYWQKNKDKYGPSGWRRIFPKAKPQ